MKAQKKRTILNQARKAFIVSSTVIAMLLVILGGCTLDSEELVYPISWISMGLGWLTLVCLANSYDWKEED